MKLREHLHSLFTKLSGEFASTPRLAAAVGLGAFVGSTPFFGFHAPIGIALSRVLKLNMFAVILGTQISMPFLAPVLVIASVECGHFMLTGEQRPLVAPSIDLALARSLFNEWLLGSLLVGACAGAVLFVSTFLVVTLYRGRQTRVTWTGRSRGTGLGYSIFFYTLRTLGRRGGYALLFFVSLYYVLFAPSARRCSREYLARVLGPRSFFQRQLDAWRHFQTFGRSMVDRVLVMAGGSDEFTFEHENVEHILNAHRAGRGALLLSAHVGSWAMAGELLDGVKPTLVVYDNEAENIREFYVRHRRGAPPKLIIINDGPTASLEILRALREGELVAMLADRVREGSASVTIPFLGEDAEFPLGPFLIAALSGAPVISTFSMKEGATHHHFFAVAAQTVAPATRDQRDEVIRERAQSYVRALEATVRRYPYQWYNFFDFWAASKSGARSTRSSSRQTQTSSTETSAPSSPPLAGSR